MRPPTCATQEAGTEGGVQLLRCHGRYPSVHCAEVAIGALEDNVYNCLISPYLTIRPLSSLALPPMVSKRSKKPSSALVSGGTATEVPPEPLRSTASTSTGSPPPSSAGSPPPSSAGSPPPSAADPPKLPPAAWKTGVQLEFMVNKYPLYLSHQNEGKLDRFWPPIFDYWQKTWPIDPPAKAIKKYGGREAAILVIRSETQVVRVTTDTILHPILTHHPSENSDVVSQHRSCRLKASYHHPRPQARLATQSKREADACPGSSLLCLCLGVRSSRGRHQPVGEG